MKKFEELGPNEWIEEFGIGDFKDALRSIRKTRERWSRPGIHRRVSSYRCGWFFRNNRYLESIDHCPLCKRTAESGCNCEKCLVNLITSRTERCLYVNKEHTYLCWSIFKKSLKLDISNEDGLKVIHDAIDSIEDTILLIKERKHA